MKDHKKKFEQARGLWIRIGGVLLLTFVGIIFSTSVIGEQNRPEQQEGVRKEISGQPVQAVHITEEPGSGLTENAETESGKHENPETPGAEDGSVEAAEPVDLQRVLAEMKGYWEAGNMEAVRDLAHLSRYRETSAQLAGTTRYYYMGDTDAENRPHGKGLAIYADHQYYYGSWKDGLRDGDGMWIKYYVYGEAGPAKEDLYLMHSYTGEWKGDLPHGKGAQHYELIEEHLKEHEGYNRNFIGTFEKGYYHGEMYITNYYRGGNVKEWTGHAIQGVWQPMGKKDREGRYPVIVEIKNDENYQWLQENENKNAGVTGLISSVKKQG